jgi:superfamily II DNA or RNA helicase
MDLTKGYIYIRIHHSYDIDDVCKLGKATNIPERDNIYSTGEVRRGYFEKVFEVAYTQMGIIEKLLHYEFKSINVIYDAGTEFFRKSIINQIEPYLLKLGIKYRSLSNEEINGLVRINRVRNTIKKININELIELLKNKKELKPINKSELFSPREDQLEIINNSIKHFEKHEKGLLCLMCGVGKTLISLWTADKLKMNKILIGVPNKLLVKQWEKVIKNLFPSTPYLLVLGGVFNNMIANFIKNNINRFIIITTYSSAHRVKTATEIINFKFDFKINDETHHLTSNNIVNNVNNKNYIQMLNIESDKQLSLTATLKYIENNNTFVISNNNINYFGEIIDKRNLLWAIKNGILCDYSIQTIITEEEELNNIFIKFNILNINDKRLFLSSYCALKSIYDNHSHHILIYSNNKNNSEKLVEFIKLLLDNDYFIGISKNDLYYNNYHSEIKLKIQKDILNKFEKSKYGILTNVYCLGEGWDLPLLDAVVFSENMTSNIRIVQSALRASRKDTKDINKKTKIILPILNNDEFINENESNNDLKKIREIIYQIGLEDENIIQKIKAYKLSILRNNVYNKSSIDIVNSIGEYDAELTDKILLKTINRNKFKVSYEKAKQIIKNNNIKSKTEYYNLCDKDIRLSKEAELTYKDKFINWIDYLGIERIYYDIETCKNKIHEYLLKNKDKIINNIDLALIKKNLCEIDNNYPPSDIWLDYYNIKSLSDIIILINNKKVLSSI